MSEIVPFEPRGIGPATPWSGRPQVPEGYPESRPEVFGFRHYLAIVGRQIWLVLASVAVFFGAAAYIVFSAPPEYRAEAVVRLADTRRQLTGGQEASAYDAVLSREADVLLSQIQVMMSRQVAGDVVEREGLRFTPLPGEPFLPQISKTVVAPDALQDTLIIRFDQSGYSLGAGPRSARAAYGVPVSLDGVTVLATSRPRVDSAKYEVVSTRGAVETLRDNFKAVPRQRTDVIDLYYVAGEPRYAQKVVNAIAETFQQYNAGAAQQASRRRRIFLEEQMRQTDAMLQNAMADYSAYRSGQQVFSSREKASAQEAGIVTVDMRRADLNAQRRTYQSLLGQAQRSSASAEEGLNAIVSSPGIAANPVIQQLYAQLSQYEEKRDSMVASGASLTNPDVIRATALVTTTTGRLMSAVRNQIQALDAQIEALDALRATSTAQISSAPRAETEEARLAQQVQAVQTMSDRIQEDLQKAKMAEAVEAGQVEIVDLADVPIDPISAGRIKKLALGLILGLLVGIGGAILVDGMNTSIRRRDDVEKILQIPGLAVIPQFVGGGPPGRMTRALPGRHRNGNGKASARAAGLVTVHDARSSSAEAYRTLRTNLIFSQAVQALRTIVVTSAAPSEGKTTTAANMAVAFAQQGMRVLIVDCDLRRSRLHKMFSIPREPGLTELVIGKADIDTIARETSVTGLYVLPSGQLPPNPSELLGGERMQKTLQKLSEAFDLVVLDTPPLLAASDAAILATLVDGVVLVVRAGVTEADAGIQALQQLTSVGARVVGAVLNDPDSKVHKYGGYYKYEYAAET